ncbi:MAG: hypothetical protein M1834_007393 [Cirrosporium novae-zelandiae]|nr:MAG: hypothetical protein M1834_007393 [Cirrosporium novae-zelandiae]
MDNSYSDDLSDDVFDTLPPDAISELEQEAIQFTQQLPAVNRNFPHHQTSQQPSSDYSNVDGEVGVYDDAGHIHPVQQQPRTILPQALQRQVAQKEQWKHNGYNGENNRINQKNQSSQAQVRPQPHRNIPKSKPTYPHRGPPITTQNEQWGQTRYHSGTYGSFQVGHQAPIQATRAIQHIPPLVHTDNSSQDNGDSMLLDEEPILNYEPSETQDTQALQARIDQLLQEQQRLQRELSAANSEALAKAGEISIVRANQERAKKEHDRTLEAIQMRHHDEIAQQQERLEYINKENQRIATANKFLQREVEEEGQKTKGTRASRKEGTKFISTDVQTTPKKSGILPFRDGFDDGEIMPVSPSKRRARQKPTTPKAGEKRKRGVTLDSPLPSLQFDNHGEDIMQIDEDDNPYQRHMKSQNEEFQRNYHRYHVMQYILNHHPSFGQDRTVEALTKYAFPSEPQKHISSIFLEETSLLRTEEDIECFPGQITKIIITKMWHPCLDEKYYEPLPLIMELTGFALSLEPEEAVSCVMKEITDVSQLTASLNAYARIPQSQLKKVKDEIITDALTMLYDVACGWISNPEDLKNYWRHISFEHCMFFSKSIDRGLENLLLNLQLFSTSIFPETFGPIIQGSEGDQNTSQHLLLGNLTNLLFEDKPMKKCDPPYSIDDIAELRQATLSILDAISLTPNGGEAIATHDKVIIRLIRLLHSSFGELYNHRYGHHHCISIINMGIRLLYHILTNYQHLIDIDAKLRLVPGDQQKYSLVLARIAFSTALVIDKGIEDDVIDKAHELLENKCTPEEAESLMEVFSSARK